MTLHDLDVSMTQMTLGKEGQERVEGKLRLSIGTNPETQGRSMVDASASDLFNCSTK